MRLEELIRSREQRVVAVETAADSTVFFFHDGDGFRTQTEPFRPLALLSDAGQLDAWAAEEPAGAVAVTPLEGGGRFSRLARFADEGRYESALKFLKKNAAQPYMTIRDMDQQALTAHEVRLFREMRFPELRRLQFDLETLCSPGFDFPNPEREEDAIVIIAMRDSSGWECVLSQDTMSEKELIEAFVAAVIERDPDVIEGHNCCRFDFPYLEARAKRCKVPLKLGRGKKALSKRASRFSVAERLINYTRYEIYGRHVVDTLHLAMFYDAANRDLESYNLKYLARHFGFAAADRTYVDGSGIDDAWVHRRGELLAYARDDVRETEALSALLSPAYFYQTQIFPMKYQDVVIRGNGTSLDALLTGEYLRRNHALPMPEASRPFVGALTRVEAAGVFRNVWHCDVRSLYPSIILAENWVPARDELAEFPRLLAALRRFRLEAKDRARAETDPGMRRYFNAIQSAFKITINSFYGYLGFSQGTFNDYAMAERVTARGREILQRMLEFLRDSGAGVLEMDTDGIYFQPPAGVTDKGAYAARLQGCLPPGIEVELDASYQAMFSYKSKNYALLGEDGRVDITGAALKSRGMEPFLRDFVAAAIRLLLEGKAAELPAYYEELRTRLEARQIPLEKLAKTETLNDSPESYQRKLTAGTGRRSAAYELALKSGRDYRAGDQVTYFLTGEKKKLSVVDNAKLLSDAEPGGHDENIPYYLGKLEEQYRNFADFLESGE